MRSDQLNITNTVPQPQRKGQEDFRSKDLKSFPGRGIANSTWRCLT